MKLEFANGQSFECPDLGRGDSVRAIHAGYKALCEMHGVIRVEHLTHGEMFRLAQIFLPAAVVGTEPPTSDRQKQLLSFTMARYGLEVTTVRELYELGVWKNPHKVSDQNEFYTEHATTAALSTYAQYSGEVERGHARKAIEPALKPERPR